MGIEKIFEEDTKREEAVDELRGIIRKSIDESAKAAINEKYNVDKTVKEEDSEDDDEEDDEEDEDEESEDDEDEDDEVSESEKTAYDRFFEKTLKLWKVDSPEELSDEEKKEFYDYIDKNWESDKEEEVEESSEEEVNEAFEVDAHRAGSRGDRDNDKFTINRMSDLKKLAKSRQYDYFMVKNRHGEETDYSIDPQGNLVEM